MIKKIKENLFGVIIVIVISVVMGYGSYRLSNKIFGDEVSEVVIKAETSEPILTSSPTPIPTLTATPMITPTSTPILTPTSTPTPTPNARERGELIYDVEMPAEHQWYLYDLCKEHDVDFELALSTIWKESRYTASASSSNNNGTIDAGYFQINECNWEYYRSILGVDWDPKDPYDSIDAGVLHIKSCMQYDDDPLVFMMAYNFGPAGAKKHWNKGTWSSTYSRSLVAYMEETLPELIICEDYEKY